MSNSSSKTINIPPSAQCIRRMGYEYKKIKEEPVENIDIIRDDDNILVWYFMIKNLQDAYSGGEYIGKLCFPKEYPFKAPTIEFLTPSGRFEPGIKICTTFSHYHPEEWSPQWTISSILIGLVSFFYEESTGIGSICCTDDQRKKYALDSKPFNEKLSVYSLFVDKE
jgi:ubiquitin-conjugating enzyme E2 J2